VERNKSRKAFGLGPPELAAEASASERPEPPPGPRTEAPGDFGDSFPDRSPCAHCGWHPEDEPARQMSPDEVEFIAEQMARLRRGRNQQARSAKVGRNDPGPCGSGRKHKHCCGC
jgi:hypothetical protein